MAKLVLSTDDLFLEEIPLSRERLTIGRHPHNDIVLELPTISSDHAVIVTILDNSFLEDLGSTNGTRVNGLPVSKHVLVDQDCFTIGHFQFCYQQASLPSTAVLRIVNGPTKGRDLPLAKAVTTIGRAGLQVAEVSRQDQCFNLLHREGKQFPSVNGQLISDQPYRLTPGDVLEIAGIQMVLLLNP